MKVNRRNLIAVAGASLAVMGCKSKPKHPRDVVLDDKGLCRMHGDNPRTNKQNSSTLSFNPEFYSIISIGFSSDDLKFRVAHFKLPQTGNLDQIAANNLARAAGVGWNEVQNQALRSSENEDVVFRNQHKIYCAVAGAASQFDRNNLVQFTELSGKTGNPARQPNFSFYNAELMTNPLDTRESILYFENWFLDENGKPISQVEVEKGKEPREDYSMNLHLLLGNGRIPVIIDPDTGNMGGGGGNEP